MKGLRLFFTACLAPLVFQAVAADTPKGAPRTANRRTTTTSATTVTRPSATTSSRTNQNVTSRTTTTRATPPKAVRQRTTTDGTNRALHTRTATTLSAQSTSARTAATISPRTIKTTSAATTTRNTTRKTNRGRSATETPITRDKIMSRDTKKCREVFYGCMDEFCANKDTQLKRCACSTRINEFRGIQKNLEMVEDKLLDFGQRLLTVSMDKEDAAAINTATEGELAYAQDDKSKSKKMLDEIAKKLNTSFNDSNFDQGLNAISLSLNTDMAFDTIDPTAGASTTTKSGTALYSAALPICREMALEVCSPDELSIAEGGYQMLIEQDCNTVKKTYQNQSDAARSKVFENGALLDMSRLDVHQQRNSDDILTCKSKMLDMLTDSTVCGKDMGKCLDTSGQYINPTTGEAILTPNLANLAQLIKRPESDNQTWATANSRYVSFLNGKKKYLEPTMEKCQDVADVVWEQFIEDALAQIKLAQDAKLEQVRQSCTTLTAQCLDTTLDSITEFDARALSIFGISADKTANAMCADVKLACTALFQSTTLGDTPTADGAPPANDWESGMTEITTTKSYETILTTCREVGRNCIIQACTSITGNFGLCEDIDKSINRKSIINRLACWDEVYDCVASAGNETIAQIMKQQGRTATNNSGDNYKQLYSIERTEQETKTVFMQNGNTVSLYDICANDKCGMSTTPECQTCRIAEEIWGNCENRPKYELQDEQATNKIYVMNANDTNETLLSWFARNTGTANKNDSCRDTTCPAGQKMAEDGTCTDLNDWTSEGYYCPTNSKNNDSSKSSNRHINIYGTTTNCCNLYGTTGGNASPAAHSIIDIASSTTMQSCCIGNDTDASRIEKYEADTEGTFIADNVSTPTTFCSANAGGTTPEAILTITLGTTTSGTTKLTLICTGSATPDEDAKKLTCNGEYLLVTDDGIVVDPYFRIFYRPP